MKYPSGSHKERAHELVAKMTLEEKCSQLLYTSPAIERLGIPAYNWWNEGLHGLARSGTATMFPQAIGIAAAFDEELAEDIGKIIGTEARARYNSSSARGDRDIYKGVTIWSPNINIFRDPRWGRGHETYGEDPYLTGVMGSAFVRGLQGKGEYMTAAACAKHFAVHSGPEPLRHGFDAQVSKKDLNETYLPAFKELVKEGAAGVMGAYNRVNGEPACANTELMKTLREDWGFDGYFVSDCWAVQDFHLHHGVTSNFAESAAMALKAGCDLNCGCSYQHLLTAHEEGLISEADIDRAAEKLFEIRFKLGLFDKTKLDKIPFTAIDTPESNDVSLKAARESMVLLKNDGLLPLDKDKIKTVAVIGPSADCRDALIGNYHGTASCYTTFLQGIQKKAKKNKIRVLYAEGCDFYREMTESIAAPGDRLAEAAAAAEASDVVILCVGLNEKLEGEEGDTSNEYSSGDKRDLQLPESQRKLIKTVLDAGKPTVIVLAAGSSVFIDDERMNALLCSWYPGPHGGKALVDILFGKVSPSGKLPVTFYKNADLLPDFTDYSMKNRTYRYLEDASNVWYPFGYGLTYSDFSCELTSVDETKTGIAARVSVKNHGTRDSGEVIQLYISCEEDNAPPNPWLCAFKRIYLKAGESAEYKIPIKPERLLIYDENGEPYNAEQYRIFCEF